MIKPTSLPTLLPPTTEITMCVGCAAAYAAIAASTITYSVSDFNDKDSAIRFPVIGQDLFVPGAITTTPSGTPAITLKSDSSSVKDAALNRGLDRTSHLAI